MKKKLMAVFTSLLMAVAFLGATVPSAGAAELTTIFLEKSASETQVYPAEIPTGDYLRVRALFIGTDGNMATTFDGTAIGSCDVTVALNADKTDTGIEAADIKIIAESAGTEPMDFGPWQALSAYSENPESDGYIEFAISVDDVRTTGTVVLTLTIDDGTGVTETSNITFEIVAPVANGYVVRTGAVTAAGAEGDDIPIRMPLVGEEVPDATGNGYTGIPLTPGQSVTVNVFAVYDCDGGYIFTDQLPTGADSVILEGQDHDLNNEGVKFVYSSAAATLTSGYASSTVAITDLKIPELLAAASDDIDEVSWGQLDWMNDIFDDGVEIEWEATSAVTREVGPRYEDTVDGPGNGVIVDPDTIIGTVDDDTSYHGVGTLDSVMMVGLPVTSIQNGNGMEAGLGTRGALAAGDMIDGDETVSPLDAYLLLDDPTSQPATFTAVCATDAYMYGALLGWDAYDNPAPVADSDSAYFYFNDGDLDVYDVLNSGAYTYISPYYGSQSFVPFAILNDVPGTITNVYVSDVDDAQFDPIDCIEGNGVDFIGQAYAQQLTTTLDYADPTAGEFNGSIEVAGLITQTYTINKAFIVAPVSGLGVTETAELDLTAAAPVVTGAESLSAFDVNTAIPEGSQALFLLEGANGALMVTTTAITTTVTAGDVSEIELLYPDLTANVVISHLDDNDKILYEGMYKAYDEFGNEVEYDASDYIARLSDSSGAALSSPWAAGDVTIDGLPVMDFDVSLASVPTNGVGYFQMAAVGGTPAGDPIETNVRVISSVEFMPVLTAVAALDVPVLVYLADQSGNRVAPPDMSEYIIGITTDNNSNLINGSETELDIDITSNEDSDDLFAGEVVQIDAADSLGDNGTVGLLAQGDGFLGLNTYDLVLESDFDYEAPAIDIEQISDGRCTIVIPITDNEAVDIDATIATIVLEDLELNEVLNGEDNDSAISGVVNGTGATITIDVTNVVADDGDPAGPYRLYITAIDEQGNDDNETEVLVNVDVCVADPAECLSISPAYLNAGETGTVVITGSNTAFDGTETVTACTGVTVGTVTATSATQLSVQLTVAAGTADTDPCAIAVDDLNCLDDFAIVAEPPCTLTAAPATLRSGWLIPRLALVTITGDEDCDAFTFANSAVTADERLIPLLSIPIFNTIMVPTLIWPGTTDATVTLTVGGEDTTTIEVVAGVLP